MSVWKLTYHEPCAFRPFLFYAAFGNEELSVKAQEWGEGSLRASLRMAATNAAEFRDGVLWDMVCRDKPELAARVGECTHAVVVKGEVAIHDSLDYLRETIEYLTYLTDQGATAIFDPFTFHWHSAEEWQTWAEQGSIFNPFDHVSLLNSSEEGGATWLHTRGMLKFGRPDLSVRGVTDEEFDGVKKMLDRFIAFQALGGIIEPGREVVMPGLQGSYRPGEVDGDFDDPNFNNAHIEIRKQAPAV